MDIFNFTPFFFGCSSKVSLVWSSLLVLNSPKYPLFLIIFGTIMQFRKVSSGIRFIMQNRIRNRSLAHSGYWLIHRWIHECLSMVVGISCWSTLCLGPLKLHSRLSPIRNWWMGTFCSWTVLRRNCFQNHILMNKTGQDGGNVFYKILVTQGIFCPIRTSMWWVPLTLWIFGVCLRDGLNCSLPWELPHVDLPQMIVRTDKVNPCIIND